MLPGITGWAQIHGRAALPWDERIELDVWYVEHRSPRIDLQILLRTPLALFGGTYKGETGGWGLPWPKRTAGVRDDSDSRVSLTCSTAPWSPTTSDTPSAGLARTRRRPDG